jgi:RNA 3'-phosphate cyclase
VVEIDGSTGEGGGQILRSALALSAVTGKGMRIENIRARRSKPGLRPQHLASVRAAAKISNATVKGAELGSSHLTFEPQEVRSGRYRFDIGTAGSTSLLLQAVFIPLALSKGTSHLVLSGGTHVPNSPCFHYLELNWLEFMRKIGYEAEITLEQAGYYPAGGGSMRATIRPAKMTRPLDLTSRGVLRKISGFSGVANLSMDIATRQKHQALRRLEHHIKGAKIKSIDLQSPGKGTFLLLKADFEHSQCCYCALGEPGKRAEIVADEAVDALEEFLETDASVDQYLADQLLLPLAFVGEPSQIKTAKVTQHLLTNAQILRLFLPIEIEIQGELGKPGTIYLRFNGNRR